MNLVEERQGGIGKSVGTGARGSCKSSMEENGQIGSRKEVMFLVFFISSVFLNYFLCLNCVFNQKHEFSISKCQF